ncbi:hypothetical protein MIND_00009000 [Mycena indigotica]|uniref:Uncharacterized protein n=1 Tax=Mycena indigotica TaxID=2126181 RepID=A0A8H6TFS6_9AGAR|nr:uncharacterized protein MIND_00009000 [Mycena indigotica]KAF7314950.1 hypothetical protein MIND_00009000 [Mycena indigotica]
MEMISEEHDGFSSPSNPSRLEFDHRFGFNSCPNGTHDPSALYPSPPPTASQYSVPLPMTHTIGGILDSPIVHTKTTSSAASLPLSPPPTITPPTRALPHATLLLPIPELSGSYRLSEVQLLSPISPEWPDQSFGDSIDGANSVLMSVGGYLEAAGGDHSDQTDFAESPSPPSPFWSSPESDPMPLSPAPSFRELDEEPPWIYSSPKLMAFASLPASDLDDLDIDMECGPGPGGLASPSRRSVSSLPMFEDDDLDLPSISPPSNNTSDNALCLDLPQAHPRTKTPYVSILDGFTAAELVDRLPQALVQSELEELLAVRGRAQSTITELAASTGQPKLRRKRAKELARETDALLGLELGIVPSQAFPSPPFAASKDDDPAGLAGLGSAVGDSKSLPQLVARMILRRRERGLHKRLEGNAGKGGRKKGQGVSKLREGSTLDVDDAMDVGID